MHRPPIRVLLVEDSLVATTILKRMLASCPDIVVVGTARTGTEGLALIPALQPQVICTDLHMPQMDGLEFTQEVMANCPRPILVISSSVQEEDTQNVFRLLQAGAVDVFPKPRGAIGSNYESVRLELINKIKILSGVAVFTLRRKYPKADAPSARLPAAPKAARTERQAVELDRKVPPRREPGNESGVTVLRGAAAGSRPSSAPGSPPPPPAPKPATSPFCLPFADKNLARSQDPLKKVLAIGASTGGPQALHAILTQLPENFPLPVICVQHISEGFLQGLVDWLASECQLPVRIAPAYECPKPGTVYFPPEGRHLELDAGGRFIYSAAPPVSGHRPSVSVTFNSVASFYGKGAAGVLLTGMGRDGADGLLAIAKAGGLTVAQDEASCVVFGMPKEAIALGAARHVLPVSEIASLLLNQLKVGA
ncbi:chemotaxis-specific protein-glutamate methyltransferase CheB [Kamptonema formosum]|uniref:chemotaxis-specific protein-glutamate methyltransferase CheB n=1 Tax=Kamptonema formosum TaxID=331992 RepID=UPI00037AAF39|nr:chemotaxis-specific protein-glutamate methyltransferase CheB [Oscillatoria sp. PCC 10802]